MNIINSNIKITVGRPRKKPSKYYKGNNNRKSINLKRLLFKREHPACKGGEIHFIFIIHFILSAYFPKTFCHDPVEC